MNAFVEPEHRFAAEPVLAWAGAALAAAGMPEAEAKEAAGILVRTSLKGVDTHGISRVPLYVDALREGRINPRPKHGAELRHGVLHYEGDRGLGQFIGVVAVRAAIERARTEASVTCLIHRCGHLAALGAYVEVAAEAGMVAVLTQATQPWMALPGWTRRAIGNNPLAFAVPLSGRPPLVFDMASSVVARGYVRQAVREKTPLPEGWAIGPDGAPTTDAETAWAGAVLPVGGYKGMGLAMLVQALTNSLQGSSAAVNGGSGADMGGFLLVLNPALIGDAFEADVDGWLSTYLGAAGPNGRYPGQRAAESERRRRAEGIPVPPGLRKMLIDTGTLVGVPFALEPLG